MGGGDHARKMRAYLEEACAVLAHRGVVRPWRDWQPPALIGIALVFASCGGEVAREAAADAGLPDATPTADAQPVDADVVEVGPPPRETICFDGRDDDGDGLVDCDDLDCASACVPAWETRCFDGVDNDRNGLVDCDDPYCSSSACVSAARELNCSNGLDDDNDGLVDDLDPDCTLLACELAVDYGLMMVCERCDDGVDDDRDGLVDCADPNCLDAPACLGVQDCFTPRDTDGDGLVGCDDRDCCEVIPECWSAPGCPISIYSMPFPYESGCSGGVDDDGDGLVDCADPDCRDAPACAGSLGPDEASAASQRSVKT
jgi:hypothetical protein